MTHSRITLRERHKDETNGFHVWTPSSREGPHFEPSSVDLRLNDTLLKSDENTEVVKVDKKGTYPEYTEIEPNQNGYLRVEPKSFYLGSTEEIVTIPRDSVGFLHGRSSVGRLGLFIHNAGLVDAGFSGELTLELYNPEPYAIDLIPGMRIAQMTLHEHDKAPDVEYSERNGNKYQEQMGPTPSRLYGDFTDE